MASKSISRVLVGTLVLSLGVTAQAQEQTAENKAAARALAIEGTKLADAGDCEQAVERLTRAEALYHAPTILGRLGECQVRLGKLVEGSENLNRVVREALDDQAPTAFREAKERAARVLAETKPRIARLTLSVTPAAEGLTVLIGHKAVPLALLGAARPTDPGTHEVVVEAPGYLSQRLEVTLGEGQSENLSVTLEPDPNAGAVTPPVPVGAPSAPPPSQTEAAAADNTLTYVAFGVGGAGLVFGTTMGLLAMGKKNDLECRSTVCPPSQKSTLDSAENFALLSNIGFGVGLAGVATGVVLLLTGSSKGSAEVGTVRLRPGISLRPIASPGWLGINGTF